MSKSEDSARVVEIDRATLETCPDATGTVVVIDVLRAFTTAAFAFGAGAEAITLVGEVEEAFALRDVHPDWLLMGEERGLPVEGFDFGNSPAAFVGKDLTGRRLVQRTSSGTQGVVRSVRADNLLAASLCCVSATAVYLVGLQPEQLTMVITGSHVGGLGDEDQACADYLEGLIQGERVDLTEIKDRVRAAHAAQKFVDLERPEFVAQDLAYALDVDRFGFAMVVRQEGAHMVMRPDAGDSGGDARKAYA